MTTTQWLSQALLAGSIAALCTGAALAEDADLAKQLANPVSSLISVPIQYNYDHNIGAADGHRSSVVLQPVVPFSLNEDWNLIFRTILPIVDQKDIAGASGHQSGLGDTVQSLFFGPKDPTSAGVIWGVGPVLLLPTATDKLLGTEKWGAGPTGVALVQNGAWTYGGLVNHIWSFAGDNSRADVNSTFIQPFVTYITPTKTTFALNVESTYDWMGKGQWSVPVHVSVSQLLKVGNQPFQIGVGARYWAESPENGPKGWGLRSTLTLLFP